MFNDDIPGIDAVAPARERGLKFLADKHNKKVCSGRSREGAWIEMYCSSDCPDTRPVAPARERGLKFSEPRTEKRLTWSLPRGSVD